MSANFKNIIENPVGFVKPTVEKSNKNNNSLCSVHKSVFYRKIKNRGVNAPRFFHDTTVSLPSSPNFTGTISFRVFLAMSSMRSLEG